MDLDHTTLLNMRFGAAGEDPGETPPEDTNSNPEPPTYTDDDIAGLKAALKAERESRKQAERMTKEQKAQLERFKEINPDEYQQLQQEAAEAARIRAQWSEARDAIEEKYSKQATSAQQRAEQAEQRLQEYQKRYALEKVFIAAGGRPDSYEGESFFDMMANKISGSFRQEPDGSLVVVDAQGDPVLDQESGKRISPADYIASFKSHPIMGTFFVPTKGSGSGLPFGGLDATGAPTQDMRSLSSSELFELAYGK